MMNASGMIHDLKGIVRPIVSAIVLGTAALCLGAPDAAAQTVTYDVTISTANIDYASTDADVFITFYGTQSRTGEKSKTDLDKSGDDFQRGDVDTYQVSYTAAIGELERIKLEHNNSGDDPGWYVNWVKVQKRGSSEVIHFTIDRWLSVSDADGLTYVTVNRDDFAQWARDYANRIPDPEGEWDNFCSGGQRCNSEITRTLSLGGSQSNSWSDTVTKSLSVAVEKEAKFPLLGKAKVTATGTLEDAKTKAGEEIKNRSSGYTSTCGNGTDLTNFIIDSVWQWTEATSIEGQNVIVSTCNIVCTPTGHKPLHKPGHPMTLDTCLIKRDNFTMRTGVFLASFGRETYDQISAGTCTTYCEDKSWCKAVSHERNEGYCILHEYVEGETDAQGKVGAFSSVATADYYYHRKRQ